MHTRPILSASLIVALGWANVAHAQEQPTVLFAGDSSARIYHSDRSGYADATRLVIRDGDTWRRAWVVLAAGRPDTASPPHIDFRQEVVILAAFGARPSAGHAISIDTVRRSGIAIEAVVRSRTTSGSCMSALTLVQPVDVVRIPRSERPVYFTERLSTAACK
jgi:hypothetical protein